MEEDTRNKTDWFEEIIKVKESPYYFITNYLNIDFRFFNEKYFKNKFFFKLKNYYFLLAEKVLPRFELGLLDSKSRVLTVTP